MSDEIPPYFPLTEIAVFLDVDGTLLAFEDHPDDVVADADLRALLSTLTDRLDGALALVSGRTLSDLDRIMAPLMVAAAGTHGAELRLSDGSLTTSDPGRAFDRARADVDQFAAAHSGLFVEQKPAAVTLHYRNAPAQAAAVAALVDELVADQPTLMVQHGKDVAEIKLRAISKGSAIATLMGAPPYAGRRPMFIGDDLTDEHGFESVSALNGVAIKVGEGDTVARYRLADVAAVRAYLGRLARS